MKNIISIYIYGSMGTGKNNKYSDIDVFVVYKHKITYYHKKEIEKRIRVKYGDNKDLDISYYSLKEVINMADEGSLLLWHLSLEGMLFFGEKLENLVENISEFKHYEESFFTYKKLFLELNNNIITNNYSFFDINLMAVLFRNLLILASNKQGNRKFDKNEVFDDCTLIIDGIDVLKPEYQELLNIRSYYKTGKGYQSFNVNRVDDYLNTLGKVINKVGKICKMDTDLQISYAMTSKPDFLSRYKSFENMVYLERGIYTILSKKIEGKKNVSRKCLEIQTGAVFKTGINLLMGNKIYRRMSSNYEGQPVFLKERIRMNNTSLETNEKILKLLKAIYISTRKIKLKRVKEFINIKIDNIDLNNSYF